MAEKSRTEYSARNTTVAMIGQMLAIVMGFVTRVVFTHTLNENYVGINGLFTDILNVLALSELGVGTAITYSLYRPIAEQDREKQKSLMRLYCWFYRLVALTVLTVGLLLVPFMDILIKNRPDVEHLTLIYLMYLSNSVLSYLLIYKKTLIDAHQKLYIGALVKNGFLLLQDVVQILILIYTKNFILYLSVYILCTLGANLLISWKADRMYPYLKEKNVRPLDQAERQEIWKNIKAMLMHKVGDVMVNNTDNLLLSSFVGIVSAGCYSNYYLLIGSIRQILQQIFAGITASVGNMGVTEDTGRVKKVFETSFFIGQWLYGFTAICLFELLNPFVEMSFGKKYLFSEEIVLILCVNFFVSGMRRASLVFHDSLGLFWFDRYKSVAEAAVNLVVSILLVRRMGTVGVFLGTFVSTMTTSMWVEPYVFYKHCLHTSSVPYFTRYGIYSAVLAAVWIFTDLCCRRITGGFAFELIGRLLICVAVPNICFFLCYCRTAEFRFVMEKVSHLLAVKKKGRGK